MFHEDTLFKRFDAAMMHGSLKLLILAHLRDSGTYPYAMLKHFRGSGHSFLSEMKKSEMYNMINSLEREGFIAYHAARKGMRQQKYYVLTPKGRKVLRSSKRILTRAMSEFRKLVRSEF